MKKVTRLRFLPALLLLTGLGILNPAADADEVGRTNPEVISPNPKPGTPAFLPLPPGAVRPQGWLRDWAEQGTEHRVAARRVSATNKRRMAMIP